jgi:hypothetical protein
MKSDEIDAYLLEIGLLEIIDLVVDSLTLYNKSIRRTDYLSTIHKIMM